VAFFEEEYVAGEVLVIGAGVAGLTTAVYLAEQGHSVQVYATDAPQHTTSVVAGAILGGPLIADPVEAAAKWNPIELVTDWHRSSLAVFTELAGQPGTGVRLPRGRLVNRGDLGEMPWARQLPGFAFCTPEERAGFATGFWMNLPMIDMPRYLAYLTGRLETAGATLELQTVDSLEAAAKLAAVVVNCTGVGARTLAGDPEVFPLRGQHVVVANPGLDEFFFEQNPGPKSVGIYPHEGRVILGGTADRENWSLEPDPSQTQEILDRCTAIEPRLEGARVLGVEVGLRAARPRTRVEAEPVAGARVIHNYGHGGVAVGLSWGCARTVEQLLLPAVRA
jgi:D-amino-acid oxidase